MGKRRWCIVMGIVLYVLLGSTANSQEKKDGGSWAEKISPMADLRYRHEEIDQEESDWRTRDRIRARLGVNVKPTDDWNLVLQFASGSGEPVSTNQTLDGAFGQKPVWIDLAYFDYHPEALKGLNVYGGKMRNPFFIPGKNQLIWDHDLNPEGLSIGYKGDFEMFAPFIIGSGFWLDERETDDDDGIMYGGQAGVKVKFNEGKTYLVLGGGYYDFKNTKGYPAYFSAAGNSFDVAGNYVHAYELTEGLAEFGFHISEIPIVIYGDYVVNNGIDEDDDEEDNIGWCAGVNVGKADKQLSWAVKWQYRELQKDAVIGAFSDSDFGGGGTNNRGNVIGVDFAVFKNVVLSFTYFMNERNISEDDPKSIDYNRMQLDLMVRL